VPSLQIHPFPGPNRIAIIFLTLLLPFPARSQAQGPSQAGSPSGQAPTATTSSANPSLSTTVDEVSLDLAVHDRSHNAILDLKPDYSGAHEALARLYLASGDNPAGLTEVNAELSRTPSNPFLLELRGDLEIRLGLKTEAQADWKKALSIAPDKAAAARIRTKLKKV